MDKLKKVLSGEDNNSEDNSILSPVLDAATLSWSTRIKGFIICFVIGIFLSLLGSIALFLHKGMAVFAIFYTLGNITSLASTCFLMGPVNQMKKMFASTRIIATILVLSMIVLTLFAALYLKNAGLALLFIILQSVAMTWYSISYIPYARTAVKKTFTECIA
ncbi:vesicle transport protein SFT2B [Thrips palmi]|uniref:Vesicle transport protein n=1 Tax=Thrips palmi TaxID=161013 RepID=A0A6P8ZVQ0_THRPL|nr:vesicle transport protein SFT2B [Thrips palmi]XP_034249412.1 vesicle transport protein SFT2B [Thrips palmi]XP_034249413.1 vesicle transport protein SFT2B [Thrips palmi]